MPHGVRHDGHREDENRDGDEGECELQNARREHRAQRWCERLGDGKRWRFDYPPARGRPYRGVETGKGLSP